MLMVLTLASMVTSSARLWVCSWYLHWRPWLPAVPGCGCIHGTYIGVHGYQQCQVVGVFMVLTLASMVTSSARLWVYSWYLHWHPWLPAAPGCGCARGTERPAPPRCSDLKAQRLRNKRSEKKLNTSSPRKSSIPPAAYAIPYFLLFRGGGGGRSLDKKFFPQSEHVSSQIWCQKFFPLLRPGTPPKSETGDPPPKNLRPGTPSTWTWDPPPSRCGLTHKVKIITFPILRIRAVKILLILIIFLLLIKKGDRNKEIIKQIKRKYSFFLLRKLASVLLPPPP